MSRGWMVLDAAMRLAEIQEREDRKANLKAYCLMKLHAGDWHAVQDSASDIRELDAQLALLKGERCP